MRLEWAVRVSVALPLALTLLAVYVYSLDRYARGEIRDYGYEHVVSCYGSRTGTLRIRCRGVRDEKVKKQDDLSLSLSHRITLLAFPISALSANACASTT